MGDPRKIRKKYQTPTHPWQKERIENEKKLKEDYGLRNKEEIWHIDTILKRFKDQVKALASRTSKQAELEEKQLVTKLTSLGIMTLGDPLDSILGLDINSIMERRLQTILVRKDFARTMKQARQFIIHGHITINNQKITSPSYLVKLNEEPLVGFIQTSGLSKDDHPERMIKQVSKEKVEKKKQVKEDIPPTFSPDEIAEIEEKGIVTKKETIKEEKIKKPEDKKEELLRKRNKSSSSSSKAEENKVSDAENKENSSASKKE